MQRKLRVVPRCARGGQLAGRTSYEKSTWPGVSMRLSAYVWPSLAVYRMRAVLSLMVMPRSRSRSMPSRYCACSRWAKGVRRLTGKWPARKLSCTAASRGTLVLRVCSSQSGNKRPSSSRRLLSALLVMV